MGGKGILQWKGSRRKGGERDWCNKTTMPAANPLQPHCRQRSVSLDINKPQLCSGGHEKTSQTDKIFLLADEHVEWLSTQPTQQQNSAATLAKSRAVSYKATYLTTQQPHANSLTQEKWKPMSMKKTVRWCLQQPYSNLEATQMSTKRQMWYIYKMNYYSMALKSILLSERSLT